jgi:FKBP-type peptidyl-prolyl cis-trans isomerase SlyD
MRYMTGKWTNIRKLLDFFILVRTLPQGNIFQGADMKIEGKVHVEIEYTLKLESGEEVDKSEPGKPLVFVSGIGQIIPGLEKELEGKEQGESLVVVVEPENGYGAYNEQAVNDIPKTSFPEGMEIEEGMVFQAQGPQGPTTIRIKEIKEDSVLGDFNHPLAGERLTFDVKITEVREMTEDELAAAEASCSPEACGSCGCSDGCAEETKA